MAVRQEEQPHSLSHIFWENNDKKRGEELDMAAQLFAAIDVGSFKLELGIYEIVRKNGLRQVEHLRHVIALGKNTYSTGKISYELVDEMCRILEEFTKIMKSYQITDYRAYATTAMRLAKNNRIILEQIRVRTGISVKVLSNSEQRLLTYKAIAMKEAEFQKIIQKGTAIADVSFGSMQISLFDKDSLVSTQNLPLGVMRIGEILSRIPSHSQMQRSIVEEVVDKELGTYKKMYLKDRDMKNRGIKNLIAIGELVLYLARDEVDTGMMNQISAQDFIAYADRLCQMSLDQVEERFGVNAGYASLLVPAAIIFRKVVEMTGAEMIWIPGIRMCDGIAAEYALDIKKLIFTHNFDEDILIASRNMAKRYRCGGSHSQCVEKLALQLFDVMKKHHGLTNRDRLLLQIGAIIHGCGKFISTRDVSSCAYNIIMATEIIGLSHEEREMIAKVVRSHAVEYDYVDDDTRVAKLTALLRLANALDTGHKQKVSDCRMSVKNGELVITANYTGNISLELLRVALCERFFEEIFGIKPVLKKKRRG